MELLSGLDLQNVTVDELLLTVCRHCIFIALLHIQISSFSLFCSQVPGISVLYVLAMPFSIVGRRCIRCLAVSAVNHKTYAFEIVNFCPDTSTLMNVPVFLDRLEGEILNSELEPSLNSNFSYAYACTEPVQLEDTGQSDSHFDIWPMGLKYVFT